MPTENQSQSAERKMEVKSKKEKKESIQQKAAVLLIKQRCHMESEGQYFSMFAPAGISHKTLL